MPHYVLHEIGTGELVRVSKEPFPAVEVTVGLAVEFFKIPAPILEEYEWNPKNLMWRKI